MANGEPMAIETTHLSAKRFPALRRSLVKYTSLYTALAEVYDVRLAEAEETIETSLATPREAGLLGTDVGLPMLMLSRHSLDADGRAGGVGAVGVPGRPVQVRGAAQAARRLEPPGAAAPARTEHQTAASGVHRRPRTAEVHRCHTDMRTRGSAAHDPA